MKYTLFPTPSVAIVVTPHPDDSEIGCGGTIAKWIKAGAKVIYLLCTNGDKGSAEDHMTSDRLASIRAEEQFKAASVLGVEEVISLSFTRSGSPNTILIIGNCDNFIVDWFIFTIFTMFIFD